MSADYFVKRKLSHSQTEVTHKTQSLQRRVDYAIKHGLIYKVVGGWNVPKLKLELAKRGYIEIIDNVFKNMYTKLQDEVLMEKAVDHNEYEQAILSKMIGIRKPKFVWTEQPHFYEPYSFASLMNKILVTDMNFWLKDGLLRAVRKINARTRKPKDRINYPRSYDLSNFWDERSFKIDFKLTLATNLIHYLNSSENILNHLTVVPGDGVVILDDCFQLILDHIRRNSESESRHKLAQISLNAQTNTAKKRRLSTTEMKMLKDAQEERRRVLAIEEAEFTEFNNAYKKVINEGAKICISLVEDETIEEYIQTIITIDELAQQTWPWRRLDTTKNIWLVKPSASGEGVGIKLFTDMEEIIEYTDSKNDNFIVQKYIEHPLLIYNTKFDLRQYFLVTIDEEYFRVWCHPICSVKLASEEFNLENFNESIHLTNASIQQKYFYKCSNPLLPHHHMWNLGTFILYLENELGGKGHMWNDFIYPEIKRSLKRLSHSICFHTEMKSGRFELFGCDWIIGADFKPYLLEINRPPCLGIYSPVSTTVCGTICEDIVKVAVDFSKNPEASTGGFEIIYEEKHVKEENAKVTAKK